MYTGQHLFFKKNLDSYYTIYAIVVYSIVGLAWIYVEYTYVEYMYFFNSFCWLSQYRFMLERRRRTEKWKRDRNLWLTTNGGGEPIQRWMASI